MENTVTVNVEEILKWVKKVITVDDAESLHVYVSRGGNIFITEDYVEFAQKQKKKQTYTVYVLCLNCGKWQDLVIPKGKMITDCKDKCGNCGSINWCCNRAWCYSKVDTG